MEHTRNGITTSGNLYTVNDMTPETVMSELNLFRTTTSDWNLSASQVAASYSNNIASNSHGGPHSPSGSLQSTSTLKSEDHSDKSSSTLSNGEVFNEAFHSASEFPMSPQSGSESRPSTSGNNSQGDEADGMPPRKKRNPVPADKKDAKYWDRRKKNNEAAKRSRDLRRKKMEDELKVAKEAMQENQKLKQEIDVLKAEINSLRRLLKDANMTLSLWIRARQASEPTAQLPPMLRGSNVSFVNFPVSSGI